MRPLKKLPCSINLCNILGKSYEQNIVDLLIMTCEDANEINAHYIEYNFYYNGTTTEQQLKRFLDYFKEHDKYIKIQRITEFNSKTVWFSIVTPEEHTKVNPARSYHVLKEVSESSLTQAFLDYYSKAKLQIQMSRNCNSAKN